MWCRLPPGRIPALGLVAIRTSQCSGKKKGGVKWGQPSPGCNPALWQDIPGRGLPRHSSVLDHGCFSFHQEPSDPTELSTAWRFCSFHHEAGVFAFDELINPYVAYLFKLVCRLTRREGFIFNEYLNGSRSSAGCHGNCSPALQPPGGATVPSWMLRGGSSPWMPSQHHSEHQNMQQDGNAQPGAGLGEILSLAGFLPLFPQKDPSQDCCKTRREQGAGDVRVAGAGARGCVGPLHGSRSWSLCDTATSTARGQAGCPFPGSVIWLGTSHQGDPQTGWHHTVLRTNWGSEGF